MMMILNSGKHQKPTGPGLKINQFCIAAWQNCDARYECKVAYVKKAILGGFELDHLHRVKKVVSNKWKYSSHEDIQNIEKEQLVQCVV